MASVRRLYSWGNWHNTVLLAGLSYARKSIIGKLMDSKGVLISGTNRLNIPENPAAEEVGELLFKLRKCKPKWYCILKYHYTNDMKTYDKAKNTQLSLRNYQKFLLKGEKWINRELFCE